tara:strand:- start:307 stop:924 length:618 start_codon:yes stop_codon:yes gene_type:complete
MNKDINIQLPEDISDITLEQSQKYLAIIRREDISIADKTKRIIVLFTGLKRREVDLIDLQDYDVIVNQINKALDLDVAFEHRFFLNGIEYGFIPNLDEITAGEYIDLSSYGDSPASLHKVLAIMFRPIILSDAFGNYEIETYSANSEYATRMKQAPMNIVNGMLVFFCLLSSELQIHTLKYIARVRAEAKLVRLITSRNGAGTQR